MTERETPTVLYPEACRLLQEAIQRYHSDPVLHARAHQAATVMQQVTPSMQDNDGTVVTITGASWDDWVTAAAVALVVAERLLDVE